jgi:hypothetical protein
VARELTNRAVEQVRRARELLFDERDLDAVKALWADDATVTMHDAGGLVADKDAAEDFASDLFDTPEQITWSSEVLAVRGDLLCLERTKTQGSESLWEVETLLLHEANDQGIITRGARFQDLKAAHDCLNEWWIESLPPELAAVASAPMKLGNLIEEGDGPGLDRLLADQMTLTDHRPVGFGLMTKHQMLAMWLGRQVETPGFMNLYPSVLSLNSMGCAVTFETVLPDGFMSGGVGLMVVTDDSVAELEFFDPDDLDTALTRFDELTSSSPS